MNRLFRDWILALCLAVIVALIIRTWFYSPYNVPTSSMELTILAGDHVFVDKNAYGFHIPFTDKRLFSSNTWGVHRQPAAAEQST